ncbi:SICAvar, type II [Plasmodium knowlesi strain H]|uniref:SICAvar, type II n=2 Tax=Plasmodium knowlesi (strain H) TaxID=5851 RepID=A0A679KRK3_PLAKH|nr:SICAvar, type II [Plasmodium knowlesi strain H]CAA9986431.1 SICAvar, type II [Plasmodium knowlesi strain H]SBO29679.1 SICAvar, type II [Plasmodium knowlesi strain H]VVS75905.1 SICAvar, type II [Plasmodium knowlesi strain H]
MAPKAVSAATPSKTAKSPVDQQSRLGRGLKKLSTAFTTDLKDYGPLLSKCQEGVDNTSNSTYKTHKSILCEYITSAVRGTYGNKAVNGKKTNNQGPGSSPGSSTVFSGLDRTHRCKFLRICMKYLIKNYCISEDDVKTILEAMKERVESWSVEGHVKNKQKYKKAFGKCISKPWNEEKEGEKKLKCSVINIIKVSDRGKEGTLNPLKSALTALSLLPGGGSGNCSNAARNRAGSQYENDCSSQPNAVTTGTVVDDDVVDSEDEDDDDPVATVGGSPTPSLTSHSTGKGIGNSSSPSLSSFPFDSIHPYLPLVPSILGIITITYYLWKYFGQLGKIRRFRRAPLRIPGPSIQEQLLDHVEEAGPHEYRLVKERKPRSAPTRTKRSGRVNRGTIIEIHFEVLDECQKGDTQLNQKDFLELLVQEFMGSELMEEEEQVPKEDVLMEHVPILGSRLLV